MSGTKWTDADYAARGYGRLSLRLPESTIHAMREQAEKAGTSVAAMLVARFEKGKGKGKRRDP